MPYCTITGYFAKYCKLICAKYPVIVQYGIIISNSLCTTPPSTRINRYSSRYCNALAWCDRDSSLLFISYYVIIILHSSSCIINFLTFPTEPNCWNWPNRPFILFLFGIGRNSSGVQQEILNCHFPMVPWTSIPPFHIPILQYQYWTVIRFNSMHAMPYGFHPGIHSQSRTQELIDGRDSSPCHGMGATPWMAWHMAHAHTPCTGIIIIIMIIRWHQCV